MTISLNSNLSALRSQRGLAQAVRDKSSSLSSLASGLRINRASDDAAGLAISDQLGTDARLFGQAVRNINDGLSAISIAEGALRELSNITIRITELAEQAANGVYSNKQRAPLDREAQRLRDEFNRIVQTTEFNGIKLLNGSASETSLQVGINSAEHSRIQNTVTSALQRVAATGTFAANISTAVAGRPNNISSGDLNNDGIADVIVQGDSGGARVLLLGNGDGTFQVSTLSGLNGAAVSEFKDLDGDGDPDYIVDSGSGLTVARNSGNATFTNTVIDSYHGYDNLHLIDLNEDNVLDLVGIDNPGNFAEIRIGLGGGTFAAPVSIVSNNSNSQFFDWNEDGHIDMLDSTTVNLSLYLGNGNGSFGSVNTITAVGSGIQHMGSGDVNNDGHRDIVFNDGFDTYLMIGNGNGTFKSATTVDTAGVDTSTNIAVRDLDGDGFDDIITGSSASGEILTYIGNGDGTFKSSQTTSSTSAKAFSIIDLNNDGALDIVIAGYTSGAVKALISNTQKVSSLYSFNLNTRDAALEALDIMPTATTELSKTAGELGATQSRLIAAARTAQVSNEQYLTAASQIKDADIAQVTANLARQNIREQAAVAILSQAKLEPQIALKLLQTT